jgi:hypothetical protein
MNYAFNEEREVIDYQLKYLLNANLSQTDPFRQAANLEANEYAKNSEILSNMNLIVGLS